MRIRVYHEPDSGALGGAEAVSATIAHALRDRHAVELISHSSAMTAERLGAFAGVDLAGVDVRSVERPDGKWHTPGGSWWELGRRMRAWKADLSRGCDLFIVSTHGVPPFNTAPVGAVYVHFPVHLGFLGWPWGSEQERGLARVKGALRRATHSALWRKRWAGYQLVLANSQFSAQHTRERWGVSPTVVYPPVAVERPSGPKERVIAALGRFTPTKRQAEMVALFRARVAADIPGWELVLAGGTSDPDYLRVVRERAGDGPVRILADASAEQVRNLLARAAVFWHPAGAGVDPVAEPHLLEHFGIATVEAMSAGCVPVALDRGGQPEIVRDGVDGFLCPTLEGMADRVAELARDGGLRYRLSASARERAREFGRDRFVAALRTSLKPLTG